MASNAAISIDVPQATLNALRRSMDRAGAEFGKSVRSQVKIAAWAIGRTLGTSTRVAPSRVELAKISRKEAEMMDIGGVEVMGKRGRMRKKYSRGFIGSKYFGGKQKTLFIRGGTITQARKDLRAQIYRFGLAKLSWRASIVGLGSQARLGVSKASAKTIAKAMQNAAKVRNLQGDNPSIMVGSYLNYAQDALIGGPAAIAGAIDRAARYMMHIMDAKAAEAVQKMARAS